MKKVSEQTSASASLYFGFFFFFYKLQCFVEIIFLQHKNKIFLFLYLNRVEKKNYSKKNFFFLFFKYLFMSNNNNKKEIKAARKKLTLQKRIFIKKKEEQSFLLLRIILQKGFNFENNQTRLQKNEKQKRIYMVYPICIYLYY